MIALLKTSLNKLLKRQNQNQHEHQQTDHTISDQQRCQSILNYWLDSELFDLPECPMESKHEFSTKPADLFSASWGDQAEQRISNGSLKLKDESRLLIMFQCHIAGYIIEPNEAHPNYRSPRTYLVAQAMVPKWNSENRQLTWQRSTDDSDLILNLATMRTLYRKCPESIPSNVSLSEWIEARMETIENLLHHHLAIEEDQPLTTEVLQQKIILINRQLANEFWPDATARSFMKQHCQPIESAIATSDIPHEMKDGTLSFRWRFCYYPDGNDQSQLGPFFVQDLEQIITQLNDQKSTKALSQPLSDYLLSRSEQIEIKDALTSSHVIFPLTQDILKGRWPENPKYGLSLLQTVAVNVANQKLKNPIVAVNGPPGTGKTTLLKDIIADNFVNRTLKLLKLATKNKDWFEDKEAHQLLMEHSIIVASSNNKAVENISKELPALNRLHEMYQAKTQHFKKIAPENDWGIFCAVLGKSENRRIFQDQLKQLQNHLNSLNDFLSMNHFYNALKKGQQENADKTLVRFLHKWKNNDELELLLESIENSSAYRKYEHILEPFCEALDDLLNGANIIEEYSATWQDMDEEHWSDTLAAFDLLKRQWYKQQLAQKAQSAKLEQAIENFLAMLTEYQTIIHDIEDEHFDHWQLDQHEHLLTAHAYAPYHHEDKKAAESRLQLSAPFSSEAVNHIRTQLFITALAVNEALIEHASAQLTEYWQDLGSLINGKLETQETEQQHQQLWAMLFLCFPVVSSSLASVENQFKLMQKKAGFGTVMFDESGQAVNYHVVGLLQRCQQAIFVGDPIQLEPVFTTPPSIDLSIARDFLPISDQDGEHSWADDYLIGCSSAQSIADKASQYFANIGERKVGLPLLVHRRCTEPMFSIANKIAYDDKMVLASQPPNHQNFLPSGWINVNESANQIKGIRYRNETEAETALNFIQFLAEHYPEMLTGGLYVITPFTAMSSTLRQSWKKLAKSDYNHPWMMAAFGTKGFTGDINDFANHHIGTVHTFQGKEASTVIFCTAASQIRNNAGGIQWVNSQPNLINVAVTRAKHHVFIIGDQNDWALGTISSELQSNDMMIYPSLNTLIQQQRLQNF